MIPTQFWMRNLSLRLVPCFARVSKIFNIPSTYRHRSWKHRHLSWNQWSSGKRTKVDAVFTAVDYYMIALDCENCIRIYRKLLCVQLLNGNMAQYCSTMTRLSEWIGNHRLKQLHFTCFKKVLETSQRWNCVINYSFPKKAKTLKFYRSNFFKMIFVCSLKPTSLCIAQKTIAGDQERWVQEPVLFVYVWPISITSSWLLLEVP